MSPATDSLTQGGGSAEWRTPIDLFHLIDRKYQLTYDAFASHVNTLCPTYSTIEGTFRKEPNTGHVQIDTLDGFDQEWYGRRVWMNPPYGRGLIARAMKKAAEERGNAELIVALIPVATGTAWWRKYVEPYADVYFVPGRVKFRKPDGSAANTPGFDSAVTVYRRYGWI